MDKLFLTILNMSLTGAFVIAAICLARLPLKKAPKIISYCLWAVAGFRLVFPFSIEGVFSLIPFKAQTIPMDIALQPVPRIDSGIPFVNNAVSGLLPAATPAASVNPLQIWTTIGAFVWLIGVAAMVVYAMASFVVLKRKMREAVHIEANIYEAENIKSPFVLGILNPRIYLPVGLSEKEKSYIILHEQTHIKRHDHIVKFAAYFILCLHWFNPLAWAAFLLMGVDMEMSCDERVLKETGGEIEKDYSLSLLSLATQRRYIGGTPLAFGEGGIKERIKNVLNFKKPSRIIVVVSVALAAVLSIGFLLNRAIDRNLPMQGINLSDLQTDAVIRHIVEVTGAKDDRVIVPGDNFQLHVSDNFDWMEESATISMFVSRNTIGGNPYFACQLRIFTDERNFWVTEPQRQALPQSQYDLRDYLDALKYLPQEHIRSLTHDNPDMYMISLADNDVPDDNQPCVFYNMNGLSDNVGWTVRLDIQPLYQDEDGGGYHGLGADIIHVFYGGAALFASTRTYSLENPTDKQKLERMSSVTLHGDGTAWLSQPPISSYLPPNCTYAFADGELLIYASIETQESESAFGVKNGDVIARFTVADDNTLVFQSAAVPLFADEGARYVAAPDPSPYEPRKWLDYYFDEQMPWDGSLELELPEYPGTVFQWTPYKVKAVDSDGEKTLLSGMPVWNVYLADLTGDGLPEFCATVSLGSGIIDERVIAFDYATGNSYDLSDRMYYDYALYLDNGRLMVKQTKYPDPQSDAIAAGELAIAGGELIAVGIDRTKPEIDAGND